MCNRFRVWMNLGKRKRSTKEKFKPPLDSNDSSDFGKDSKGLTLSKLSLDEYPEEQFNSMEVSYTVTGVSPSSISSSGSETEICTNDEGREGMVESLIMLLLLCYILDSFNFYINIFLRYIQSILILSYHFGEGTFVYTELTLNLNLLFPLYFSFNVSFIYIYFFKVIVN